MKFIKRMLASVARVFCWLGWHRTRIVGFSLNSKADDGSDGYVMIQCRRCRATARDPIGFIDRILLDKMYDSSRALTQSVIVKKVEKLE